MNSCEMVAYVSTIACAIAKCSSAEEMELMSAVLIQLGETLHMMLVHDEVCAPEKCRKENRKTEEQSNE